MKNARMKILSRNVTVTLCFFIFPFIGADSFFSSSYLSATTKHCKSASILHRKLPLKAATVEISSSLDKTDELQGKTSVNTFVEDVTSGWECNEEAECVKIPACDGEQCQTSLDVRIHNTWYDLSGMFFRSHGCNVAHYTSLCDTVATICQIFYNCENFQTVLFLTDTFSPSFVKDGEKHTQQDLIG